jgi:hypothetical protein
MNILETAPDGPVPSRRERDRAQIASLVGKLEKFGTARFPGGAFHLDATAFGFREVLIVCDGRHEVRHFFTEAIGESSPVGPPDPRLHREAEPRTACALPKKPEATRARLHSAQSWVAAQPNLRSGPRRRTRAGHIGQWVAPPSSRQLKQFQLRTHSEHHDLGTHLNTFIEIDHVRVGQADAAG